MIRENYDFDRCRQYYLNLELDELDFRRKDFPSLDEYLEEKHRRTLRSGLLEDIEGGDYNEYFSAYWVYINQYSDGNCIN